MQSFPRNFNPDKCIEYVFRNDTRYTNNTWLARDNDERSSVLYRQSR